MWRSSIARRRSLPSSSFASSRSQALWPPLAVCSLFAQTARCESSISAAAKEAEKATSATAAAAEVPEQPQSGSWRGLKALVSLTSLAFLGGVSYVTYAYPTEEVEKTIKSYRQNAPPTRAQSEDLLEKVKTAVYSASYEAALKAADTYLDFRRSIEDQVKGFAAPSSDKLLPDLAPQEQHVYTIVLDLNETLVYSDWKRERGWGTFKRPGVDAFLEKLAHYYEIVVYSDQLNFYIDPILERLDQKGCIRFRLARDATYYVDGKHYRDLSKLNRDPKKVMYISGHALENCLQPENAIPVKPWKLEENDTALLDLLPFLEFVAKQRPPDIRAVLASYQGRDIASEFRERAKQNQRRVQERKQKGGGFWR